MKSSLTVYVTDPAALDTTPTLADIPARRLALPAWKITIPWLILVVGVIAAKVLMPRESLLQSSVASGLDIVLALLVLAGVLIAAPFLQANIVVLRWNRAYRALAADPHRAASAELQDLTSARRGFNWQVYGTVHYRDARDGSEHSLDIGRSLRPLVTLLAPHEVPDSASRVTVWHTADHNVAQAIVLVGAEAADHP